MKKFLITGADFNNKGGQSMLFITINELRLRFPGCEIYFPTNREIDGNYKLTPVFYCIDSLKYMHGGLDRAYACIKGITKMCLGKNGTLKQIRMLKPIFSEIDALIDISGFNLSSDWNEDINYKFLEYIRQAKKCNIPVFLMPQSFGPFDYKRNQDKMDRNIRELLGYCQVVFAREKDGYDLLINKYGLNNVALSTDLVLQNKALDLNNLFIQPPEVKTPILSTIGNVAVIPNMKSIEHGDREKILELYQVLIERTRNGGKTVYLFQHSRNDFQLCQWVKELFQDDAGVVLVSEEFDCLQYSRFVRQFDFIIASRYHAIVHALKEGVPCVALGWAVKYMELLNKFEMGQFVFNVTDDFDTDKISEAVDILCKKHQQWSEKIVKTMEQVKTANCFDVLGELEDCHENRVDATTVKYHLCNSCGVCVGICPKNSIKLEKNTAGQYVPVINENSCIHCGLCSKLCQGQKVDFLEMAEISHLEWNGNLLTGQLLSAYTAFAEDPVIRAKGVSGGCVTALVKNLLDAQQYDCAFTVNTNSYSNLTCAVRIGSSSEMIKTPLSKYVTVSHEETVKYIVKHPEQRVIITAVPCAVQGILRVIEQKKLNRDNYLLIGLVCDKTMTNKVFDYFEKIAGEEIQELYFRTKKQSGWPGNVGIQTAKGIKYLPSKTRTRVKEYFQPERCLYCLDKINRYADIVFGDDYTGGCSEKGGNVIIVNTARGQSVLDSAPIEKTSIEIETVFLAMKLNVREKNIEFIRCFERKTGLLFCPQVTGTQNNVNCNDYKDRLEKIWIGSHFDDAPEELLFKLDETDTFKGKLKKCLHIRI